MGQIKKEKLYWRAGADIAFPLGGPKGGYSISQRWCSGTKELIRVQKLNVRVPHGGSDLWPGDQGTHWIATWVPATTVDTPSNSKCSDHSQNIEREKKIELSFQFLLYWKNVILFQIFRNFVIFRIMDNLFIHRCFTVASPSPSQLYSHLVDLVCNRTNKPLDCNARRNYHREYSY